MTEGSGRLMGLETEYAIRVKGDSTSAAAPPTHLKIFEAVCERLQEGLPAAAADSEFMKRGWFLGTGGAVWFESLLELAQLGLIEGATPECREARSLLAAQRAQDRLLGEAALQCNAALLKNCHDSFGNIYGAQENYEFTLASGSRLWRWTQACVFLVLPSAILLWIIVIVAGLLTVLMRPLLLVVYWLQCLWVRSPERRERAHSYWVGSPWRNYEDPDWVAFGIVMGKPLLWMVRISSIPVTCCLALALRFTRLPNIQHRLTSFLVTRMLFCGAGRVANDGTFLIAEKSEATRAISGVPEFARPIFSTGQFMKPALILFRFADLLSPRQRIQISLGDSNMCEEAEYLRIGATRLVIDLICARPDAPLPQLRSPIRTLRQLSRDHTLTRPFRLKGGARATGIEIQLQYLEACENFVREDRPDDAEANHILRLWRDVLDCLASDPDRLIGRVDWITKRFLLKEAGTALPIAAKKKLDAKYHELSDEGYFRQFETTGLHRRILQDEEIESAMRLPPPGTPATTRARLIREYAGSDLTVGWKKMSNGMTFDAGTTEMVQVNADAQEQQE